MPLRKDEMEDWERRMKLRNDEICSVAACLEGRQDFPHRRKTKRIGVSHQSEQQQSLQ